jgi:hypothetical protein
MNLRAMELTELNADERTALVGLVKAVLMSDGKVSDDEVREVEDIVEAFGEDSYRKCLDAFDSRFPDEASFKKFLTTIERPDARELIYGTILTGAAADAIEGHESELLSWLAKTWSIEVTVVE